MAIGGLSSSRKLLARKTFAKAIERTTHPYGEPRVAAIDGGWTSIVGNSAELWQFA